ncbi:hypothetical protein CPB84DRAFT_1853569 [Gymnopilus junonius]|uniref:Uncharacterized protein n=1 Tax=Gymnopilus junonius TaxID=109634 RepID=A0A9P5NBX4_GYMJU|nr:hypothetical protein CPB84DRAFT_1853569 [Gymnopilus junonius]
MGCSTKAPNQDAHVQLGLADEGHGASAMTQHCTHLPKLTHSERAATWRGQGHALEVAGSRGAAECNPRACSPLSQLGDKPRGWGSGDSSGDDGHWVPEGQAATSGSLFNVRKVGSVLSKEHQGGEAGSGGIGLGRRGEVTHLRLALPPEGDGEVRTARLNFCCLYTTTPFSSSLSRFPSTSAAGSGIHVNSWGQYWLAILHTADAWCDVAAANAASSNTAGQGIPAHADVSTPALSYATPPHHPPHWCRRLQARRWADRRRAHVVTTNKPLQQTHCHLVAASSSCVSIYTHAGVMDAILVVSSTLPGMACDVIAASAALCSLANPEKALIILDQWVMQPRFAKGVLLVFPLSCCIVLKVFISVWGEEKGRSCCFASS